MVELYTSERWGSLVLYFATLMGMWAFNLKVALGAKLAGDLGDVPEQSEAVTEHKSAEQVPPSHTPTEGATAVAPLPPPGSPAQDPPEVSIAQAISQLPWRRIARKHSGWLWNGTRLHCPAGQPAAFAGVIVQGRGKYARFSVPSTCCFACPQRSVCTKSSNPGYTRVIHVPGADALPLGTRLGKHRQASDWDKPVIAQRLLPPAWSPVGKLQPLAPLLLPATLRQRWVCLASKCSVHVDAPPSPPKPRRPAHIAASEAERQHRRQTWAQRLAHNARIGPTRVSVRVHGPEAAARQAGRLFQAEITAVL